MNTKKTLFNILRVVDLLVIFVMTFGAPMNALAYVWTDPLDYAPGSTVIIEGNNSDADNEHNWLVSEYVHVDVVGPNGYTASCDAQVQAADPVLHGGAYWSCPVTLWDSLLAVGSYDYTATGQSSGNVETGVFTDEALDWKQCQNDTDNDGVQSSCAWTGGALNPQNSFYQEGDVVPHRMFRSIDTAGAKFVTFDYSWYVSSNDSYTYDFLADPLVTLDGQINACAGLPNWMDPTICNTMWANKLAVAIPADTNYPVVAGAVADDPDPQNLYIGCYPQACTTTTLTFLGHGASNKDLLPVQGGVPTADEFGQIRLDFTTLDANTYVAVWLGAHLAKTSYWSSLPDAQFGGDGAGFAPGASFHVRLINWERPSGIGNQDNQMQIDPAIKPPAIMIVKSANPQDGTNFTFNGSLGTFILDDDNNTNASYPVQKMFGSLIPGTTYNVTEAVLSGWSLSDVVCTSSLTGGPITADIANGVAITMQAAEYVTCTFYNVPFTPMPAIDIQKTPDSQTILLNGTANFTIVVTNTGNVPLTNVAVTDPNAPNCAATIGSLAVGASSTYTCSLANVTSSFTNTATVTGTYNTTTVSDFDDAAVVVDILPDISVTKTANPTSVPETGGSVEFTFVVTNHSSEPFILNSLTDDRFGNLDGVGTCDLPQTIAAGGNYSCAITRTLSSDTLAAHTNVVTAAGVDEQGNPDSASDDATVTFTNVNPTVDLTKTASPASLPEPGGAFTFTLSIHNTSLEAVTITALTDSNALSADCLALVSTSLAAGATATCTYTVSHTDVGSYPNTANVTVTDNEGSTASDSDDETVTVTDVMPTVDLAKDVTPATLPEPGGVFHYTLTITNNSAENVTITTLTDDNPLPAACTDLIGDVLTPGQSVSCTYDVTHTEPGSFNNTASVTVADNEGNPASDSDSETVTVTDVLPTVDLTKTADPLSLPEPGGLFTFTLSIHNTSIEPVTITALNDSNALSAECLALVGTSLAAGASASCTYTVTHTDAGSYDNTASVTVEDNEGNPASDSDSETVTVTDVLPTVDLTKTADPLSLPEPGGLFTFTLSIHNTSIEPVTITALTDTNALSASCLALVGTSLAAGASASCTYTVTHTDAGSYDNTASVTVEDNEGSPASDSDSETVTVTNVAPVVDLVKAVTPATLAEPGGAFRYTLTITNNSVENVTITALTDDNPLPAACTDLIGDVLTPGQTVSCTYDVTHTEAGTFPNTANVTVTDNEGSTASDSDSETVTVTDVLPTVDLTKTANPLSLPEPGGLFTFTLSIHNTSIEPVTITALTDTNALSAQCTALIGTSIPADGTVSCTYTVPHSLVGVYPNTANVTVADNESNSASDSDSASVSVTDVLPVVDLVKDVTPATLPEPGGVFHYTLTITNNSIETVTITAFDDTQTTACDYLIGTELEPDESVVCTYDVTHTEAGRFPNTASVTVTDNEGSTDDDSDSETVTVTDVMPVVALDKSVTPESLPEPGGVFSYTLTITNNSVENVTITALTDDNPLPAACTDLIGDVLIPGQVVTCTYDVTRTEAGDYDNTANVIVEDNEGNEASASDSETVTVTDVLPTVVLDKTVTPATLAEPGGVFTFTLSIHNTSVEVVTITALTDTNALSASCQALIGTSLAAGATTSCTYTVSHTEAGSFPNTASVTVADNEGNNASDSDDETVTVTDVLPTVDLTKAVDGNAMFNVGDTATFTLTIHNTSPEAVTITALTDDHTLSAECTALIGTSIPAGGTVSCTYTVVKTAAGTYPNTASVTVADNEGNSTSDTDTETITYYAPSVSKTANGTYDEVHDWEVFKSVNTASQTAFGGEKKNFTWTVRVDETTHGENYQVTGGITVVNNNPDDAITVAVSDVLNDGSVAAIGPCTGGTLVGNNLTVPAGGTAVCQYSVVPQGDIAAFAAALPSTVTMSVQYPYAGGPAYFPVTNVSGGGALNGTYEGWCADLDHTINQNTNYTANVYSSYETLPAGIIEHPENLDLVNWIINQDFVGKPAGGALGNYTYGDVQRAIWELIDDTPYSTSGLNAWNQTRVNQIKAAATANGEGFTPTCGDFVAVILQPVGGQQLVTIAQVTFASLGVNCAESNAVTAVLNGIEFPASAEILWTANPINPTATLDDDQKLDWPTTVSADTTFTYQDPQGYTCSTDPTAYTNGFYQYNESNTAVLTFGTGSDTATASTIVKCYAPVVSKTAAGAYAERHEWDVEKSVDPTSQNAFAGDTVSYEWTVDVVESVFEENFLASGTISVRNPRPDDGNMTVKLTDVLSDGAAATITGCTGGTWNATNKTVAVPPNTIAVCDYTASPTGRTANLNTVTAELMVGTTHLIDAKSASLAWTAAVIRGSATLTDDQNPAFPLEITGSGSWSYSESYTCSTDPSAYSGDNLSYAFGESNTAIVTSGDERDRDTASTAVNCYYPQIEITKTGDALSKIGDDVYYDIVLVNNTPIEAGLRALRCTISDPLIGFNKTVDLISGGTDANLNNKLTIPQTDADPFINTASVSCSPTGSTFTVSDSAQWSTNLFQPNVEVIKSGPLYATSGDLITYSFTINNLSSADSPNLILDTLTDTVLGDLVDDAPAACDELAAGGSCSFTVDFTVPDVGLQAIKHTNIVTVHYHPAGFPNDIKASDDHTVIVAPRGQLTDTSYCPLPNNQFRLMYHLETAPNIYRLQASNPGQFYYNGFYFGEPGSTFEMTLQIPYPFITQEGAGNPIQVHDGTGLTSSGCFMPNPALSGFTILTEAMTPTSSAGNQIITWEDYGNNLGMGDTTTVTVSGVVPASGMAYVTIHLDYGLKRTGGWKNNGTFTTNPISGASLPDMTNGNGSGPITIHGYEEYNFARTVGGDTASTAPASYNELKKFAGFLGFVTDQDTGDPLEGVQVMIYDPSGNVLTTLSTDEDGYYMFTYKHKAKAATYRIVLPDLGIEQSITIRANGFGAVNFEVP